MPALHQFGKGKIGEIPEGPGVHHVDPLVIVAAGNDTVRVLPVEGVFDLVVRPRLDDQHGRYAFVDIVFKIVDAHVFSHHRAEPEALQITNNILIIGAQDGLLVKNLGQRVLPEPDAVAGQRGLDARHRAGILGFLMAQRNGNEIAAALEVRDIKINGFHRLHGRRSLHEFCKDRLPRYYPMPVSRILCMRLPRMLNRAFLNISLSSNIRKNLCLSRILLFAEYAAAIDFPVFKD
ncbi:hypothetical protein SDC9_90472 [bioreactor metagenome]|uniref:Uncharacterized protein n=1 Tax=bioreactor metagenome TaxID=1076179 RepID=A0A644ZSD9_9ZZZZ